MTDELSSIARSLLDATRAELTPDATAIVRVRGKLDLALQGGAVAGMTLATKLGLLAVVAVLGIGAVVVATRDHSESTTVDLVELPSTYVRASSATTHEAPPSPTSVEGPTSVPRHVLVVPKRITLAREVELIDRAMIALRAGDPATTLVVTRTHALETANGGQLAEDIGAIEIEALCMQHAPAAAQRLTAFDKRWPSSAQRERLTRACR